MEGSAWITGLKCSHESTKIHEEHEKDILLRLTNKTNLLHVSSCFFVFLRGLRVFVVPAGLPYVRRDSRRSLPREPNARASLRAPWSIRDRGRSVGVIFAPWTGSRGDISGRHDRRTSLTAANGDAYDPVCLNG
jgi:hypothetical protein